MTCTATHTITQAELDANGSPAASSGKLSNTVTATSNEALGDDRQPAIPIVQRPALTIVKSASPPTYDNVGEHDHRTAYTVTNTGNVTVAGQITVTDDKSTVETARRRRRWRPDAFDHLHGDATRSRRPTSTRARSRTSPRPRTARSPRRPTRRRSTAVQTPALTVVKTSPTTTSVRRRQTVTYSYLGHEHRQRDADGHRRSPTTTTSDDVTLPGDERSRRAASMTCTATHTFTQAELDANGSPIARQRRAGEHGHRVVRPGAGRHRRPGDPDRADAGADDREVGDAGRRTTTSAT